MAGVGADDVVVEVGPGLGSLTLALLPHVRQVTAIEIDPALAEALPGTVAVHAPDLADRLTVVPGDAMRITELPGPEPTALVANLPYNVSVPVLLHFLAVFPTIERVLVMVQAEVADRLAAEPGSKIYGVPSVKASFYGKVKRAGSIGRHVFWPEPNIESGLVRIDRHPEDQRPWPQDAQTREKVFPVVDAAFAQRRKTLRAALGGYYGSPAQAEEALTAAGIDPKLRGERLDVVDFVRLAGVDVVKE